MRTKKILVILISIFFVACTILLCGFMLSIRKVDVHYNVADDTDVSKIQQVFNGYENKNLLFLDEDEVKNCLKNFPYFDILSVEKQFPNVLKINVTQRRETYQLITDEKIYLLTETGLVLSETEEERESRDIISLEFKDIVIEDVTFGKPIKTSADNLVYTAFIMAQSVNLTDCIKNILVIDQPEREDVIISTYSGVDIVIIKALEKGKEKIQEAFLAYDNIENDYLKLSKNIEVVWGEQENKPIVTWTDKSFTE